MMERSLWQHNWVSYGSTLWDTSQHEVKTNRVNSSSRFATYIAGV
jgi:hypothetical protein